MRQNQYNFNYGAYENIKSQIVADRLAKNRWGSKFKKLYKRHMEPSINGTIGHYDYTAGMRASVQTISVSQVDLDATVAFKMALQNKLQVDGGNGFSIDGAMQRSYASVLIEAQADTVSFSNIPKAKVIGIHFSLSLSDGISWFYSSGVDDGTSCVDYESEAITGESHNTILNNRGVEDRGNVAFRSNQDALFSSLWLEMSDFLGQMAEDFVSETIGGRDAIVITLSGLMTFLDTRITILTETITTLENNTGRIGDDLELIKHLDLSTTLSSEIKRPDKIGKIWFMFEKNISPPMIDDGTGILVPDPNYEWWKEQQFQTRVEGGVTIYGIADEVKNFQDYCIMDGSKVYVKIEMLDAVGYKVYWFVNSFLGIDARAKKLSLFARIFNFILLVVSIALTIISENPIWLKVILIGTSILGYMGVLSPEIALLVAIVSFGYGLSQVDFSAMNSMQIFSWTINNVEMVGKMLNLYDNIGIKNQIEGKSKEENKNKNLSQLQDEAMTFIYSRAYSQYDDLYNIFYDFSPQYKT